VPAIRLAALELEHQPPEESIQLALLLLVERCGDERFLRPLRAHGVFLQPRANGSRRARRALGQLMIVLGDRLAREAPQPCGEVSSRA
jgi:hypothetical protein